MVCVSFIEFPPKYLQITSLSTHRPYLELQYACKLSSYFNRSLAVIDRLSLIPAADLTVTHYQTNNKLLPDKPPAGRESLFTLKQAFRDIGETLHDPP